MKKLPLSAFCFTGMLCILFICAACNKEDSPDTIAKIGDWSGTDIAFKVTNGPLTVSDLEFVYSGHAESEGCILDYESAASFATVAEVEGRNFSASLNIFEVAGTFLTDTTAEISISWTGYDSHCDMQYTGSKIYTASW